MRDDARAEEPHGPRSASKSPKVTSGSASVALARSWVAPTQGWEGEGDESLVRCYVSWPRIESRA